jgi:hypothetical protein
VINWRVLAVGHSQLLSEKITTLEAECHCQYFLGVPEVASNAKQCLRVAMTLEQAYPPEYQRVQCAFKDSMIH